MFIRKPIAERALRRSLEALDAASDAKASGSPKRRAKARAAIAEARAQLATAATLAPQPPNVNYSNARHVRLLGQLDQADAALAEGIAK